MRYPTGEERIIMPENTLPFVSRFVVGRVYNLGNYENKRIEIEVTVPEGHSACHAMVGVERLLDVIGTDPPFDPETDYEYIGLKQQSTWTEAQWQENRPDMPNCAAENAAALKAKEDQLEAWKKNQQDARMMLDTLGASSKYTDHKLDWE